MTARTADFGFATLVPAALAAPADLDADLALDQAFDAYWTNRRGLTTSPATWAATQQQRLSDHTRRTFTYWV